MKLIKTLLLAKGASALAGDSFRRHTKNKGGSMFGKNKKRSNPLSRLALGLFVAGASAHLLKKNQDQVKEGVDNVKNKAAKAKDDFEDLINGSEELK